ncbi:uncharacterized protein G2W53_000963 [Senna tora]|uniref:Uncharacterized protein n=1 Tax=Senna tora TaxID=362788 RepID=A0A834XF12_9FABA|nr:uncharacterized protein G2W53_000963 [Senna tora]
MWLLTHLPSSSSSAQDEENRLHCESKDERHHVSLQPPSATSFIMPKSDGSDPISSGREARVLPQRNWKLKSTFLKSNPIPFPID